MVQRPQLRPRLSFPLSLPGPKTIKIKIQLNINFIIQLVSELWFGKSAQVFDIWSTEDCIYKNDFVNSFKLNFLQK